MILILLKEVDKIFYRLDLEKIYTIIEDMRELELTFQKNIRDLGGLVGYQGMKVKKGVLYRGGFLDKITEEDAKVLESLHITHVVDFRSESEFLNRPDYRLNGVSYFNFPPIKEDMKKSHVSSNMADGNLLWFVSEDSSGYQHMLDIYRKNVTSIEGKEAYRNFFKLLLDNPDGVFYFHCSQGKDRAGLAAFYLEYALGVDIKVCFEDYLKSNKAMAVRVEYLINLVKNKSFYNEKYKQSMYDVFSAKTEFLEASIEEMIRTSGSIENYIKEELQVDINLLRDRFLEK